MIHPLFFSVSPDSVYVSSIPLMAIPSERQKNRHRPISVIYDSRELSSVTKSRRIKAKREGGWAKSGMREKKKEEAEIKRREVACEKGAGRWSLEITGWSNICIAADDESPRAAVLYSIGKGI